ncbi:UNVERIFIED_CONTAM: Retrovirus-related Pol polyprotein from transposon RE2 [Sesamum radiatum]|uniref:Retrovirus-related Pol polyprotein from transposon RE2 n=1 Tax=Sesamum radiatum TaxID=300843 RepID=A0AAW2KK62_SESRA
MVSEPSKEGLCILGFSNIYESFTDQMATENTSAAVGAASSAIGSSVQVENEALQLHGADHPALFTQLMQFLMGLGEMFDHVRHQLLVMDSIPSVNRAYSMHTDWYKDLVEQKRKDGNGLGSGRNFAANTEERKVQPHLNEDSKELLLKELIKLVRGSGTQPEPIQQVNFAQLNDFAGMNCTLTRLGDIDLSYWIVDTGATNHICASPHILSNLVNPSIPTTVHLPDVQAQFRPLHCSKDPVLLHNLLKITFGIGAWAPFLCSSTQEPKTYLQASKDASWVATMQEELQALDKNGTWELTSLPPAKRAIGSWWVFKLKLPLDGSIARYKARILMGITAAKSWPLFQLDINNTFLHGHLDEEVYMVPPKGYTVAQPGQMCKLICSLYGLKQASRQWNLELTAKLLAYAFTQSVHDNCLFLRHIETDFIALLVYVDDILLTGTSEGSLNEVKQYLDKLFTIKDVGSAKYFLGLELARSTHGLHVTQHKYLQDILRDASMLDARPTSTPFPSSMHLNNEEGALLHSPDRYRNLVGRLLYLGFTRPDLSFPVQQLSQFMQHPRTSHWDAALHVLSYLKGTCTLGLFFPSQSSLHLSAYSDAA